MADRIDFSTKTKQIIAGRAGYRCSFPGCNKILIGPGKNNDDIVCIGECAHIFSAANGGPRGKDYLTDEKIQSAENGIYLCRNHHKIIDSNSGNQYSTNMLLSYKSQHETFIARELGNYPQNINWISEIALEFNNVFKNEISIKLGKVTHIYGTNGSGKTCFCKCIYDAITQKSLYINESYNVKFRFNNKSEKELEYQFNEDNIGIYNLDGIKYPLLPINLEIVFLKKQIIFSNDNIKDIAEVFNVPQDIILAILKLEYFEGLSISQLEIKTTRKKPYLTRKVFISNKNNSLVKLDYCSSSEIGRFLVDVGILLARYLSKKSTVLYVLENTNIYMLDDEYWNQLLHNLESNKNIFQTILLSPDEMPKLEWNGWTIAKFCNTAPDTVIEQDIF